MDPVSQPWSADCMAGRGVCDTDCERRAHERAEAKFGQGRGTVKVAARIGIKTVKVRLPAERA